MKKHTAYIGVGSNINPYGNIQKALYLLLKQVDVTKVSTFYITKAINRQNDKDYLNGIVEVKLNLNPLFFKYFFLKKIEKKLGRLKECEKFASRTIDLDLVLYDDLVIKNKYLKIPDKDIYSRNFLAYPLYELNPDLIIPGTGISIKEIIGKMSKNDITPDIDFTEKLKNMILKKR